MCGAIVLVALLQFGITEDLRIRVTALGSREPLPSVHVLLMKLGVPMQEARLNDGRVEFSNLVPGRYTIVAEAPGFERKYSEITLPGDSFVFVELQPTWRPAAVAPQTTPSGNPIRRVLRKLFK